VAASSSASATMTRWNCEKIGDATIEDILCGSVTCIDQRHRLYCGAY
jgi:hypothetical protein